MRPDDYFIRKRRYSCFFGTELEILLKGLGARTLLQETEVAAAQTLMIGDSGIDVLTGRNAGMWTCGVTYGFAPHTLKETVPDVVLERPTDLAELFGLSAG